MPAAWSESLNLGQWNVSYPSLEMTDPTNNNLRYALDLSLTGLANLIFASFNGDIDISIAQTPAAIHAYEGPANPGPLDDSWRGALEQAILVRGGTRVGLALLPAIDARHEGRPNPILNYEFWSLSSG